MYSEQYQPGDQLTKEKIQQILELEISANMQNGSYMSIWQLFAFCSVLQRPVVSVYSVYGGHTVRNNMNRLLLPRVRKYNIPAHIMWTNIHGKGTVSEIFWCANNCAVLLQLHVNILEPRSVASDVFEDNYGG